MVTGSVERFTVWYVNLNPIKGSEQAGYRPVLVISPAEMNQHLNTVIVAPMTMQKTRLANPCVNPPSRQRW